CMTERRSRIFPSPSASVTCCDSGWPRPTRVPCRKFTLSGSVPLRQAIAEALLSKNRERRSCSMLHETSPNVSVKNRGQPQINADDTEQNLEIIQQAAFNPF